MIQRRFNIKFSGRKNLVMVIIALILLVLSYGQAVCQVTSNVLQRVLFTKYKSEAGSAFTIEVDNRQYLVAAKHVFKTIKDKDTIQVFHEETWKNLDVKVIPVEPPEVDIIVLIPPMQLTPAHPLEPTMANLVLSQQVFFLGFPYAMGQHVGTLNRGFPLPFVKSGVCSAMDHQRNKGYTLIYVDGMNNPGFSGGPLVFKDLKTGSLKVAGVVSNYRNHPAKVISKEGETGMTALENSGILIAYDIGPAIFAIKKNPEGPQVDK